MNEFQKRIKDFSKERDWDQYYNPKDLLLGIVEEVGELRNIVKWEQDIAKLKKALIDNKKEVEDHIGDIYWFLALLANGCEVNLDEAIAGVIESNKKRFPVSEVKSRHTNRYLGGAKDGQYDEG
jgi:NTP pyrophosphatase (non-canonical NTP hydrolase)